MTSIQYTPQVEPEDILQNTIDRYENAQDYADEVKADVTNAINNLISNGLTNLTIEEIQDTISALFNISDAGISGINANEPTAPIVADITVGEPTAVVPSRPELEDLNLEDLDYNPVVMDLTSPEASFDYTEEIYSSELADSLENKIIYDLINGGTGLAADIEAAIWDRARNRQEIENEKTYDEALNFWASRGFSIPPGMLNGMLIETRARIDQNNTNTNNDILVQSSNLAQNNTQFNITSAIQIEKNLMDNFNQYRDRALEAAKTTVQVLIDIYQLKLAELQAKLNREEINARIYDLKLKSMLAKLNLKIQKHQGDIETYKAAIGYYDSQVKKIVAQAEARVSTEGLKVETFKSQSEHYKAEIDALIRSYLGKLEAAKAHAKALIDERQTNIQLLLGKENLTTEQVVALTRIASQLAASSLTSVSAGTNIGVTHSQSDSKSYNESLSGSESFTVSHTTSYEGVGQAPDNPVEDKIYIG